MKFIKKFAPIALICLFLTTGCAQRVADLTLASSKNVNLEQGKFTTGDRVVGEDNIAIVLFPLGNPSIKEATDRAIEQDPCAVALTNVAVNTESFALIFGYVKYKVEGNLVIDKNQSGCENWHASTTKIPNRTKS